MKMHPDPEYMNKQTEITWPMRSILIEWIVETHYRYSLPLGVLFLTVNYIDRFLSRKNVHLSKLQLTGVAALLIASKFGDGPSLHPRTLRRACDNGYTLMDILSAERYML